MAEDKNTHRWVQREDGNWVYLAPEEPEAKPEPKPAPEKRDA